MERERNQHSLVTLSLSSPRRENKRAKYKKKKRGGEGRKEAGTRRTAEPRENGGGRVTANTRPQNRQAKRISLSLSQFGKMVVRTVVHSGGFYFRWRVSRGKATCARYLDTGPSSSLYLMDSLAPPSPRPPPTKPLLFLTGVFSSTPL